MITVTPNTDVLLEDIQETERTQYIDDNGTNVTPYEFLQTHTVQELQSATVVYVEEQVNVSFQMLQGVEYELTDYFSYDQIVASQDYQDAVTAGHFDNAVEQEPETPVLTPPVPVFYEAYFEGSQDLTTSTTIICYNRERMDSDYFNLASTGRITVVEAGWYKAGYTNTYRADSSRRTGTVSYLRKNGQIVEGTVSYAYHRTSSLGYGTTTDQSYIYLEAGDVIDVAARVYSGDSNIEITSGACSITIEKKA